MGDDAYDTRCGGVVLLRVTASVAGVQPVRLWSADTQPLSARASSTAFVFGPGRSTSGCREI
jgi:hypothetical protein